MSTRKAPNQALTAALSAAVLLFASPARGEVLALHVGANDPETEGWTQRDEFDFGGHITGPVIGDVGGVDAWKVDSLTGNDEGDLFYERQFNAAEVDDALTFGWSLFANVRLIEADNSGMVLQFTTGSAHARVALSTDPGDSDPIVEIGPEDPSLGPLQSFTIEGGAGTYHTYELRDDDANGQAELFVDGGFAFGGVTLTPSGCNPVRPGCRAGVLFGDIARSNATSGNANFNEVRFVALPEPSTGLLLGAALLALWWRGATRGA